MSENQKTWELVQVTRIIHFQADTPEATLRASEVKPKLDRFLWRLAKLKVEENRDWILKDTKALDYKMQITAPDREKAQKTSDFKDSTYFGNQGDGKHKKGALKYNQPIKLKIICRHEELLTLLDQHLPIFFLTTNFGTRQSKGWVHLSSKILIWQC